MGDQARQSQELELWQVVSQPGNRTAPYRTSRPRKHTMQYRTKQNMEAVVSRPKQTIETFGNPTVSGAKITRSNASMASGTRGARSNPTRGNVPRNTSVRDTMMVRGARADAGRMTGQRSRRTSAGSVRAVRVDMPVVREMAPRSIEADRRRTCSAMPRKTGRRARISQCFAILWIIIMSTAIFCMGKAFYQNTRKHPVLEEEVMIKSFMEETPIVDKTEKKPNIIKDFLTISEYNRPGTKLARVDNIFVHYTANPGTSAAQNRSYFESLGQTHERAASAHFIIGYEGEIIQCIPLEEEAYAVIERNVDSISIECCYIAEDGSFTQETYDSLIEMLAWLTDKYDLNPNDILRHYDCGGKKCPIYYVEHEDAWQKLLDDVAQYTL